NKQHKYDYVLNIPYGINLEEISVDLQGKSGNLGVQSGYQHINQIISGKSNSMWISSWTAKNSQMEDVNFRTTMLGEEGTEVIRAKNPISNHVLMARRNAEQSKFIALMESVKDKSQLRNIEELQLEGDTNSQSRGLM